jgi:hypothetical protein
MMLFADVTMRPWYLSATPLRVHPWLVWFRGLTAALELAALVVALAWPHGAFGPDCVADDAGRGRGA